MQGRPVVFIDISKAYDKLDRTMVKIILRARGIAFDHAFGQREDEATTV